ncbi:MULTISPECIES: hypothetical protein [Pseudanabaena]|uniref:Cell division protein FtsL n=2 Tax=Pseudanabaena TaxID=1152 RepID=A0A9X4M8N1_9CYAN|nr:MULTISPECIES: hypothetical protein [Pseudanabaena]MDG3494944.1 hypothetical protein [Pseudanabaena catenata USMAC16]TYQ25490.1 hypothetical protein PseudUWO310_19080 [Pseudanabaena sp. UWO310]
MTASRARMPEPQRSPQPLDRKNKRLQASRPPANNRNVKRLPRTNSFPLPLWLRVLMATQKLSIAATVLLTASVFAIYGWTVYAQEQWNQQYKKLEQLQRQERQLTNAAGSFDNEMLQSIQKKPGELVRESPEKSIFLQAAPLRPKREVPSTVSELPQNKRNESLGY